MQQMIRTRGGSAAGRRRVGGGSAGATAAFHRGGLPRVFCEAMSTCLVTGGAGFLGSHLCDELLARGNRVICADNFETGSLANIEHIRDREKFCLLYTSDAADEEDSVD